jgi:hypothetical protein
MMAGMNERRNLAILGGAALVAGALLLLRRGPAAAHPPVPVPDAVPPAAEATAASPSPDEARHLDAAHEAARKARDEKRAQILAALQRKSAASAHASARAPANAPPAAGAEPPHGHYDPEYIRHVFREDMFPIMKQCYESALKSHPTLGGRLALKFSIVGDSQVGGVVEDADFTEDSDLKDDEMRTCVRESLMALTFDKPPSGGGKVTVTYPVLFSPGDDEEADGGQRR